MCFIVIHVLFQSKTSLVCHSLVPNSLLSGLRKSVNSKNTCKIVTQRMHTVSFCSFYNQWLPNKLSKLNVFGTPRLHVYILILEDTPFFFASSHTLKHLCIEWNIVKCTLSEYYVTILLELIS